MMHRPPRDALLPELLSGHHPAQRRLAIEELLAPAFGTKARWQLMEWLNFISTEVHKGFGPLWNPQTPADVPASPGPPPRPGCRTRRSGLRPCPRARRDNLAPGRSGPSDDAGCLEPRDSLGVTAKLPEDLGGVLSEHLSRTREAIDAYERLKGRRVSYEDRQQHLSVDFYMNQGAAVFNPNRAQTAALKTKLEGYRSTGRFLQVDEAAGLIAWPVSAQQPVVAHGVDGAERVGRSPRPELRLVHPAQHDPEREQPALVGPRAVDDGRNGQAVSMLQQAHLQRHERLSRPAVDCLPPECLRL